MSILDQLNPQQRQAVTIKRGPALILAGAGSGKTRVLTYRIAYLLEQGADPFHILAITFTNKAAAEMKERVKVLVGHRAEPMWISTFHSACVRTLRRDGARIGYPPGFSIYDASDQQTLIKECLKEAALSEKQYPPAAILGAIGRAKDKMLEPAAFQARARTFYDSKVGELYQCYQKRLRQNNALDFDDLLIQTVRLLQDNPDLAEYYQGRFQHILVDEYQDTNYPQYLLVNLLARRHRNLFVVGDDDQCIYLWRGAEPANILNFEADYPEATVIKLEQNYRSTPQILGAANHVIKHNLGRKGKVLWTDRGNGEKVVAFAGEDEFEEAYFLAREIEYLRSVYNFTDFAVLYRTHAQSRVLEEVFVRRQIPYHIVGGLKFYERKEIKDILAYLRLLLNPRDVLSFRRAANLRRGLGEVTIFRVESFAMTEGLTLIQAGLKGKEIPGIRGRAAEGLVAFAQLMEVLRQKAESLPAAELIPEVIRSTGYDEVLREGTETEYQTRRENLAELVAVASEKGPERKDATLEEFLARVSLFTDIDRYDEDKNAVTMMTLHSAKGLEFPVVFLVGMEEGVFPHSRSLDQQEELEEERRLCYVGMTRARERLYMTWARARNLYGGPMVRPPSRFLLEIDPAYLQG
ncbi:MAG: UvrD-helicase domain-containing protein, partial [Firmicutes bacterium]|nr:UvrD-helicase domain-containing protein [Bacillota bacterium]